ncbi:MAG: RNA polymerase factor sigma-54 [Gammaproteobacteria bacterium]|nr:RNA polymerase factor sigma-54 [Gammaproteobacteria bacterium]
MKLSLQLKLGQQLAMTPQLQQAIKLLQLSSFDLHQEVGQMLESNPMLEPEEGAEEAGKSDEPRLADGEPWRDPYQPAYGGAAQHGGHREPFDIVAGSPEEDSLQDHLLWQLNLTPMSARDQSIALAIIDAIDANGMLSVDIDSLLAGFAPEAGIGPDEALAVLHRIQQFDPIGVGSRNLAECLLLQLGQISDPELAREAGHAKRIVEHHLDLLANHDYAQLMRRAKLREADLSAAVRLIESLNPRPGAHIAPAQASYVVPDVLVRRDTASGAWRVDLNPDSAPRIRINQDYAALASSSGGEDGSYLRSNLQEARWFMKSLQSRNETLMKVAGEIVERQVDFLEYGEEAMKPLVLHDIAEAVEMHESTISRVTTQKYLHTPRGVFELKYFFSSHVSTTGGGECSSTAIRAIIRKLIAEENASKPLSDSRIAAELQQRGINVARRTIAKYRESLSIPPSSGRKRLALPDGMAQSPGDRRPDRAT